MPMLLILSSKSLLLSYSYPLIISCELVLAMLVSPPNLKVVATINGVMVNTFSGILLTCYSSLP